jgi:hypothetical protein
MNSADVAKLHSESLQLRNQQFLLGTLALTGSGLSAWLAPGITAMNGGAIEAPVLIGATISWLIMLYVLFYWSLGLRKLITVISEYLKLNHLSEWEHDFFALHQNNRKLIPSQTLFVVIVFHLYGIVVVGGSLISTTSTNVHITRNGIAVLLSCLVLYLVSVAVTYKRFRNHNAMLETLCREEFAKEP